MEIQFLLMFINDSKLKPKESFITNNFKNKFRQLYDSYLFKDNYNFSTSVKTLNSSDDSSVSYANLHFKLSSSVEKNVKQSYADVS